MNVVSAVNKFVDQTDRMAKKYNAKVSISAPGMKEVVIADHRTETQPEAQVLLDLEQLIKTTTDNLEKAKEKMKKLSEMVDSVLMNVEEFREAQEKVKKLTKERNSIKAKIMGKPENKNIKEELKELKLDRKEAKESLSDYLREYKRMTGFTQMELFDGTMMEIVETCKLVKKV